jgi:hypothetical protein
MTLTTIHWQDLTWLNPPERAEVVGGQLEVVTRPKTDFWRTTHYGFVHDDGHFLGTSLGGDGAIEVTFASHFSEPFDQAGLMLRAAPDLWVKAGVELSDGELLASAVVTRGLSDWSVAPLPASAAGAPFTIRASRAGDSLTLRYRVGEEGSLRLLRVAYLPPEAELLAGLMCCSPSRGGLLVRFEPVRLGPPDARLHDE